MRETWNHTRASGQRTRLFKCRGCRLVCLKFVPKGVA